MNPNGGLQPTACLALALCGSLRYCAYSNTTQLLSPPPDHFQLSKFANKLSTLPALCIFLPLPVSFSFMPLIFHFCPSLSLSNSQLLSLILVCHTVIFYTTCPCTLSYWIDRDCAFGEDSAGTCCPSYFMPRCDCDTVFSRAYSVCNATEPRHTPRLNELRVTNTMILHFWTSLDHESLMRMSNHA